jgi:hypothetical protein
MKYFAFFSYILCEGMDLQDIFIKPEKIRCEHWQLGNTISNEVQESGVVLIFCSDERGSGGSAEVKDFSRLRKEFYALSAFDFEVPICDLGELISGKTQADTRYVLEEILTFCYNKNAVPVVIGGSVDLSYALFSALNFHQKGINYAHISNVASLSNEGEEILEANYLHKILTKKEASLRNFHLLGYQRHLNEIALLKLMKEVDFDVLRLADMMNTTEKAEPFFRRADMVTLNCDAVESFSEAFSTNPQVNGLNRREICTYMKEIGLSENLKTVGVFNFNIHSESVLNHQLMAQMLWYLIEGINIQRTHPKERSYDTFVVLIDNREFNFKRDTFSGLWYFAKGNDVKKWIPCSREDYENAKRGELNKRFLI